MLPWPAEVRTHGKLAIESPPHESNPPEAPFSSGTVWIGMAAILIAGGLLRCLGMDFGLPYQYASVDESIVTDRAIAFTTTGDWNPHYFQYPTLVFYLQGFVFEGLARLGAAFTDQAAEQLRLTYYLDPTNHFLAARGATIVLGLLSIVASAGLGRELGRRVGGFHFALASLAGLAAASVVAFNQLHTHLSKFIELDVPLSLFVALCLTQCLRFQASGRVRNLLGAAVYAGLGAATKYYGAFLCASIFVAVVSRWWILRPRGASLRRTVVRPLFLGAAVTIGAFLVAVPYLVLDFPKFVEDFRFLWNHNLGGQGHFGQEIPQNGFVTYSADLWSWAGPFSCVLASLGLLAGLGNRRSSDPDRTPGLPSGVLVLLGFGLVYFVAIARMRIHFRGYLVPLIPVLAGLASLAIVSLVAWVSKRWPRRLMATGFVLLTPLAYDGWRSFDRALGFTLPDTRALLAEYAKSLEDGAGILMDTWLPLPANEACLQLMKATHEANQAEGFAGIQKIPLEKRRPLGAWTPAHLEARLKLQTEQPQSPSFDLLLMPPAHMSGDRFPAIRALGFRYIVITASRWLPLLENPARSDPDYLETHPGFQQRIDFYERLLQGDLIRARFPAQGQSASGPELVLCDLDLLPAE